MATRRAGIIGYPLGHSVSPAFQQAAFDHYALPVRYDTWSTPPDRLEAELHKLRGEEYLGANVTVPHKEKVAAWLDDVDPWARLVGAVNTIAREGGRLVGYNTDSHGLIRSLNEEMDFDPRGKGVLLLGAGGAARAAAFGLAHEGISWLTIANRTPGRAESLAEDVARHMDRVDAIALGGSALEEASASADLVLNSTAVGMKHSLAQDGTPLEADHIRAHAFVYDMVYNPPETPLLRAAAAAGARTLGGLGMLVFQGAASFERWTGKKAPPEVMFRAARRALASQ